MSSYARSLREARRVASLVQLAVGNGSFCEAICEEQDDFLEHAGKHALCRHDESFLPEVLHQPSNFSCVIHAQELGWNDEAHSPTGFEELCSMHSERCPGRCQPS